MVADKNTIHVLLISDKGYLDKVTSSLFKSHYDQSLFNSARTPAEAILMTRPVVIIDEPHRFKRDGKSYENIINQLDPQMIVRFGATFPLIEKGKRKGEVDYYSKKNPVYDLNAVDSFNNGLVKGVEVIYPSLKHADSPKYKVKSVANKTLTLIKDGKDFELVVGDNLSVVLNDSNFDGDVTYAGSKELSTGLELTKGMELVAGIFDNSYQEIMLIQLINEHFEKEQAGFLRDGYKIKAISLVFIDSISSYRNGNGWLRLTFEKLLKAKINELLEVYKNPQDENETEYYNYLLVTKASLNSEVQGVHGGYFASDWGEPDDSAVTSERLDILEKERTLTFKNSDGSWNLRRFFFSKWTLREGWDNPNVFVIAKLRSSGSEISKLQEVGRGLRLPVDTSGRRISNEELYVSYIIDFSEKEFASKLVGEINADKKFKIEMNTQITETVVTTLIENGYEASSMRVKMKLNDAGIIDDNEKVIDTDALFALLPRVSSNKVKERPNGKKADNEIRLKRENWNEIKDFWQDISRRYMVRYHDVSEIDLRKIIEKVLDNGAFVNPKMSVAHEKTQRGYEEVGIIRESRSVGYEVESNVSQIKFGDFLSRIANITNLPIQMIYEPIAKNLSAYGSEAKKYINTASLSRFKIFWDKEFEDFYCQQDVKYEYDALSYSANTSVLKNGEFAQSLPYGMVGSEIATDIKDDPRNLFVAPLAYDSEIEHKIMQETPDANIIVFGKVPRRAIKIPTFTGGTTTPDFVYVTRNKMKLLVEAKSDDLRSSEKIAIQAQKGLIKQFPRVTWIKATTAEEVRNALDKLK